MTKLITEPQDLTFLEWSKIRHSSGTAGSFLKATSELGEKKIYYKLSNYDFVNGVTGHESVNELIVDRLLNILGIEHLHYDLINAEIKINDKIENAYICSSQDFKKKNEEKVAFDIYYELEKQKGETPLEFCIRNNFENYIYEMLVVDFLILNRDRHGANIEVLKNPKTKTIRLAPLFDHGLSLLAPCRNNGSTLKFDVMEDKPVQSFIGSNSAYNNLELIPVEKLPKINRLKLSDEEIIMGGIQNILGDELTEKIWEMIWKRWCYYEDFCNSQ